MDSHQQEDCSSRGPWHWKMKTVQGIREDLSLNLRSPTPKQAHIHYHLKMPIILFAIKPASSHLVEHFHTDWSQSAVKIQSTLTLKGIDKRATSVRSWELDFCVLISTMPAVTPYPVALICCQVIKGLPTCSTQSNWSTYSPWKMQ